MITKPFAILDFDGVIFNRGARRDAIACLNFITDQTEAELVISSSWRESCTMLELRDLLSSAGVRGKVIDHTPILGSATMTEWQQRVTEIEMFLKEHAPVQHPFVILDDQRFPEEMFEGRHITTNYAFCLTQTNVAQAVKILRTKMLPYHQELTNWEVDDGGY